LIRASKSSGVSASSSRKTTAQWLYSHVKKQEPSQIRSYPEAKALSINTPKTKEEKKVSLSKATVPGDSIACPQ
jgi:hypothetical protein